ncbi:MAG: hypothetical protein PHV88_00445 [Eubacteriales bacterium]|nr:hypothetical protein [Eubacteriales bacterium]
MTIVYTEGRNCPGNMLAAIARGSMKRSVAPTDCTISTNAWSQALMIL